MEYRRIFGKSSRWCRLQAILSDVDNDGKPHHFILAFQDIDKEKREQELKDTSLELLRDAYYRIPSGLIVGLKLGSEEYPLEV